MAHEIIFQNEKMKNFRDFGGYVTCHQRRVKEGIFYRSGALGYIQNQNDKDVFASLHIQTIFDLRSQKERDKLPDPSLGAKHFEMSAMKDENGNDIDFSPRHILSLSRLLKIKKQPHHTYSQTYFSYYYSKILFQNEVVQTIFDELLNHHAPILIHCSAGKDRTGIIAALILLALDVDQQTVKEDYMNSNFYRHEMIHHFVEKHQKWIKVFPVLKKLCYLSQGIIEETMILCMELIEQKYASYDDYLFYEYGITLQQRKQLQQMYLEN